MQSFSDKNTPLQFVRSQDAEGKDCFFFLQANSLKMPLMQKALKTDEKIDLTKYGTVIASGFGTQVPQEIIDILVSDFGYDPALFKDINN